MDPEDFERVYPVIQQFDNPLLGKEDWRALFQQPWLQGLPVGYAIEEGGTIAGFLGTIFSRRIIQGEAHLFCNLSTWVVQEDQRGMSLMLLFEALKHKDCTFTDFTANKVAPILKRFGFKCLAQRLFVQFPLPSPAALFKPARILTQPEDIASRLNGETRRLFNDHAGWKCNHLLVEIGNDQCYIVYDVVRRKRLPFARIHHISHPDIYCQYAQRFALAACRKANVAGWMAAENLLKGKKPHFAYSIPQKQALLYRSTVLNANQIDTLYSELQLLGLRT